MILPGWCVFQGSAAFLTTGRRGRKSESKLFYLKATIFFVFIKQRFFILLKTARIMEVHRLVHTSSSFHIVILMGHLKYTWDRPPTPEPMVGSLCYRNSTVTQALNLK